MKLKKAYFAGAALLAAAVAYAAPIYGYKTVYYTDASYSTVAGRAEFTCSGNTYLSGVETDYFEIYDEQACRSGGYECAEGAPYCM